MWGRGKPNSWEWRRWVYVPDSVAQDKSLHSCKPQFTHLSHRADDPDPARLWGDWAVTTLGNLSRGRIFQARGQCLHSADEVTEAQGC